MIAGHQDNSSTYRDRALYVNVNSSEIMTVTGKKLNKQLSNWIRTDRRLACGQPHSASFMLMPVLLPALPSQVYESPWD